MEDREEDTPIDKSRLKKAKNFGWGIIRFIFGILFIASIALCVLFATGIIEIQESEDGRSFVFVSPLTERDESEETTPEEKAETQPAPTAPSSFAAYDFKFASMLENARSIFTDSSVHVDELRATTSGDYLVARLFISSGEYGDARYYYRQTAPNGEWKMIETMTSQAAPLCESMTDLERRIVRESFPELTKCRYADGSFDNL